MSALSNLMEIDIYGKCGTLKCPKFDIACYINMNQTYKFYLSFENSLCEVVRIIVIDNSVNILILHLGLRD